MNGRVYDPELGRFLSADPLVQAPYHSQSYNRYSYVFNNPLSFTDPSGFACVYQSYSITDPNSGQIYNQGGDWLSSDGTFCGQDALNFQTDWMSWVDRQQDAMVNVGGFWGGVGYVGVAVIDQMFVGDVLKSIDSARNGDYGGTLLAGGLAVIKPAKALDKLGDLYKEQRKNERRSERALNTKGESSTPDFIVSPGGTVFPVPKGVTGPTPVINPAGNQTGVAFTGGSGGTNGQVSTMRIMSPTVARGGSPGYPNGYIKYENSASPRPQGVDPYSGKTLPNSQSHFPID